MRPRRPRSRRFVVAALAVLALGGVTAAADADAPVPLGATEPLGPVVVLAHRGASAYAPEHTFAAYDLAMAMDTDFLECDLQLTADDVLVCVHDSTVDRTSDGTGLVADHTLEELRSLDWGSWFNEAKPQQAHPSYVGQTVVPFEEQLDCYLGHNPRMRFHVETKAPAEHGFRMEPLLVDLLGRKGLLDTGDADIQTSTIVIQSFDVTSLQRIKALAPTLPTAYLWSVPPPEVWSGAMPPGVDAAGPNHQHLLLDPTFVARAHANGHEVHTWTVDDPTTMRALLTMGVDGIFTNRPDLLRAEIDAAGVGVPAAVRGNPGDFEAGCPAS